MGQSNEIDCIQFSNCWFYNTQVETYKGSNILFDNCNFEGAATTVFRLYSTKNLQINNSIFHSIDEDDNQHTHGVGFILFYGGSSNTIIVNCCTLYGFSFISTYSDADPANQLNVQLLNIFGSNNVADITVHTKVKNCLSTSDTPELNEVRMRSGVLQYWNGSAWQNVV